MFKKKKKIERRPEFYKKQYGELTWADDPNIRCVTWDVVTGLKIWWQYEPKKKNDGSWEYSGHGYYIIDEFDIDNAGKAQGRPLTNLPEWAKKSRKEIAAIKAKSKESEPDQEIESNPVDQPKKTEKKIVDPLLEREAKYNEEMSHIMNSIHGL